MENFIVIVVLGLIIGCAIAYVIKARKKGVKCIGCPQGGKCSGNCSECSYGSGNPEK